MTTHKKPPPTAENDEGPPLFSVSTGELLPPPSRPSGEDNLAHQRIVRTALRLFAEHGYSAVTLNEIADACELSKGALYWYFETKEVLFRKVVGEYLHSWERRVMDAVVPASTWDEQLGAVFRIFIEVLEDRDDPHRDLLNLMTLRGAGGPGQDDLGFESLQRFTAWIEAVMADHPDQDRRREFAALVHAAGLGVLSEAAFGLNVARPVLATVLEVLGGQPLYPDRELRGRKGEERQDSGRGEERSEVRMATWQQSGNGHTHGDH